MKEHIDLSYDRLSKEELQEILEALLRHLKLRAVRTDETQQGGKHGIVSVEIERIK